MIPLLTVTGGLVGFFVLPLSSPIRLLILASDIVAAVVVALVLIRRGR
jgi:hypothetical protein